VVKEIKMRLSKTCGLRVRQAIPNTALGDHESVKWKLHWVMLSDARGWLRTERQSKIELIKDARLLCIHEAHIYRWYVSDTKIAIHIFGSSDSSLANQLIFGRRHRYGTRLKTRLSNGMSLSSLT
jgi:hypothetical protein